MNSLHSAIWWLLCFYSLCSILRRKDDNWTTDQQNVPNKARCMIMLFQNKQEDLGGQPHVGDYSVLCSGITRPHGTRSHASQARSSSTRLGPPPSGWVTSSPPGGGTGPHPVLPPTRHPSLLGTSNKWWLAGEWHLPELLPGMGLGQVVIWHCFVAPPCFTVPRAKPGLSMPMALCKIQLLTMQFYSLPHYSMQDNIPCMLGDNDTHINQTVSTREFWKKYLLTSLSPIDILASIPFILLVTK